MILLGTGHQRAAKESRVEVDNEVLTFASWSATATAADLTTVNFTSFDAAAYSSDGITAGQTYDEGIQGILSATFTFGGDWDAGANPLDVNAPPGIYPRDNATLVLLYVNVQDNTFWDFPLARFRSAQNGGAVATLVTFSVSDAKNQGPFSMPNGSV